MKEWTTPEHIRLRLMREWDRGKVLTSLLGGPSLFPYRMPLAGPNTHDVVNRYSDVREWIAEITKASQEKTKDGYTIEWREFKHPVLGSNRVPKAAVFDDVQHALGFLRKNREAQQVVKSVEIMQGRFAPLKEWARSHPLKVLELTHAWSRFLTVMQWMQDHPDSNLYLRQVDAQGVDTKFIEEHRGVLMELLDIILPPDLIHREFTGVREFEKRYGFRDKPPLVRFRFLDKTQHLGGMTDITARSDEFAQLQLRVERVFVIENEIDFLVFPEIPRSLAVFGAGYGLKRFEAASWLRDQPVYYWGDIDTHGLAILDEFRLYVPHTQSLLMDEETLLAFPHFWDREERPHGRQLNRLTMDEAELYEGLRTNRWGVGIRLEQERIPMHWLFQRLSQWNLA